jgi:predicted pyridoxine 5'-phosphate oxidase superfamily flavin-nucleotide-binding protein
VGLEDTATLARLDLPDYRARIERGFLITVEGFDWNCPQHITPRFSMEQIDGVTAPLLSRIATLEAALGL